VHVSLIKRHRHFANAFAKAVQCHRNDPDKASHLNNYDCIEQNSPEKYILLVSSKISNWDLLFRIFNAYVYRVFQKAKSPKKSKAQKTKSHKPVKLQEKKRKTFNSLGKDYEHEQLAIGK